MTVSTGIRPRPGTTLTGRIEELSEDGRGVFYAEGRRILVRGAWPGDVVEAHIFRRRRGGFEAEVRAVHHEGAPRRTPPCVHVAECGGCRWQQWPVEAQREMKRRLVERALALAMPDGTPPVLPTREAGPEFGYRNKMEFTFGRAEDGRITLGLHRLGRFDVTFDLTRCHLAPPRTSEVVAWVRAWANRHGLSAYHPRSHQGLLRHLVVRESAATGEIMAVLVTTSREIVGIDELATELPRAIPQVASLLLGVNTRKGDTAIAEETTLLSGRPTIIERIGPLSVEISPRSFLQTNSTGAEVLYRIVAESAALTGEERVLDLYCGAGLIGLWLSPSAREVVGLEQLPEAVADAERVRERAGIAHARFICGAAEEVLPRWAAQGKEFDVVVTDPPRAGMHPKALRALVHLKPKRIVYVSCNPTALAADLKVLREAGYIPGPVQPVDMFPQTPHVESVVRLDHGA